MLPLMFASALEGRSSRQLQADRRGPAPGCRGTRHNEGCQRCGFPPIRAPAHLPVNPPHHSRLRGAECGSLCTFGHLSCRMAAVSGIQDHLASQSHPDPDRERPSASLVYEERDPEYENYGCWNEWVCTCFAPVLQATSVTRDTKSETEL